jgi:Arc/MetJ-type ribon-helix-helix transcriptional regulator
MMKTTVYVPDELKRGLARLARESGRSEAELIRDAISRLVESERNPRPTLPLFRSDDPTLARRAEELLADFGT